MLGRQKHSKDEVVASKEEEDAIPHGVFRSASVRMAYSLIKGGLNKIHYCYHYVILLKLSNQQT